MPKTAQRAEARGKGVSPLLKTESQWLGKKSFYAADRAVSAMNARVRSMRIVSGLSAPCMNPSSTFLNTINIRTCHQTLLNHLSKGKNDTILHMKTCHILRSS